MENSVRYSDLIERLDMSKVTRFYWLLTILATIGGFLFGYDTANIGSALPLLEKIYPGISGFVEGYLVAGASLGAAVGALVAAGLTDRYGRKYLLIADAAIYAAGALLSAFTVDLVMLLLSRTLIGIAVGADSGIATAYIAEYAPKARRGTLGILQQWMITIGILAAYLIGMATLFFAPGLAYALGWRIMLGVAAIPALIGLAFRFVMPESPRWLLINGKYSEASVSLKKLGLNMSEEELKSVKLSQPHKITPGVKRALLIVGLFFVFQQITGINVPFYYGPVVLEDLHIVGKSTSLVYSIYYSIAASAILAIINVAATYIGFKYIDTVGRRKLALMGYGGMTFFAILGGVLLYLKFDIGLFIAFAGFIIFFAFGVGGTGWMIQGEYFPTSMRGLYASLGAFIDWIANFAIIELFPVMDSAITMKNVEFVFGVLSLIALILFYYIMPETKGLSVEQIDSLFENNNLGQMKSASISMKKESVPADPK
ncbi:sugar porter family MFS transporter [Thermoplasma sp.]|uniref:sugar porter family MFS transporter n=1 Tax=Thermoplasma sp. TaxID=1973142 RepID=UPI00127AE172|nr:sugar porter family MFS transporter [Thermoplasma sp.]KAA8922105.1 MAG: sugar porter family MFS transporter [Thermoplasma sp.]